MDRSSLSALDKSTNDERQYNLNFLKMLYTLFALELLIVFTWSSFVVGYPESFDWYKNAWWFGIIGLILAILILLFTMFGNASRQPPVNLVVYFLFTIMLAIGLGWLCIVDQSRLVYFTLATVTMIAVGFMMYAIFASSYMQTIPALLFVIGFSMASLLSFILLSDVNLTGLLLCYFGCVIFGFYINFDVRKIVRGTLYNSFKEDPFSGAVRIWGESTLVCCRFIELVAGIFDKDKH